MAYMTITYPSFVSGQTASPAQVNQNFLDVYNAFRDGTKDINVNAATFAGAIDANGAMAVAGNATFSAGVRVAGATTFSSTVQFGDTVTFSSTVRIAGAVTASAGVTVAGALTASGSFVASSPATFLGAAYFGSTCRVGNAITASAGMTVAGTFAAGSAVTIGGGLYVTGANIVTGSFVVSSPVTFLSNAYITGATIHTGSFVCSSPATFLNNVTWQNGVFTFTTGTFAFNWVGLEIACASTAYYTILNEIVSVRFNSVGRQAYDNSKVRTSVVMNISGIPDAIRPSLQNICNCMIYESIREENSGYIIMSSNVNTWSVYVAKSGPTWGGNWAMFGENLLNGGGNTITYRI